MAHTLVINTRSAGQSEELTALLADTGARIVEFPCLAIQNCLSADDQTYLEAEADPAKWLVFTSANSVTALPEVVDLRGYSVACIGTKTAREVQLRGAPVRFCGSGANAATFSAEFLDFLGAGAPRAQIIFVRGNLASSDLPVRLLQGGAVVRELTAYLSVLPKLERTSLERLRAALDAAERTVVTFTSSQAVRNYRQLLDGAELTPDQRAKLAAVRVVAVGPKTAATAREYGFAEVTAAGGASVEAMAAAVVATFSSCEL